MTAATLLEMAERDGVRVEFSPSGGIKASGPRAALAKWLPEPKAMKPAIAAAVAHINDAAHRCGVCAQPATSVSARICGRSAWAMVLRRASSARGRNKREYETEDTMPPRPSSAAALRMRRHRERRRDGMRCVTIELRETEILALIRKGHLTDDARNDLAP